ncbi:MAG: NYN domain-containing protein [Gemmataceae bacterium]
MAEGERSLAIFIDFENLALGFQGRRERFDIHRVLERMVEKGKIVVKKAYADWSRFGHFTHSLHEAAIELIEIPRRGQTGKNSADIRLVVDAMDLSFAKEHINTFVIVSGDSDFSPLVSKLKEQGKHVIGLGMQESTSDLLRDNCDEFIYYEDLGQPPRLAPQVTSHIPEQKRKAFELLLESLAALRRENKESLWSSMIKDTIKRKKPSFNETYHGYRTFSELLEDAQREGILELETDKRSRTYVVTRFGSEMNAPPKQPSLTAGSSAPVPAQPQLPGAAPAAALGGDPSTPGLLPPRKKGRRRRRRGQGAGVANGGNGLPAAAGSPLPVPGFQPVEIPPPGPLVGIEVAPSPVVLTPATPFEQDLFDKESPRPGEKADKAPSTPTPPAEVEEPTPRARSRSTKTTKATTPRPRRTAAKSPRSKKAEEPPPPDAAAPAEPAVKAGEDSPFWGD